MFVNCCSRSPDYIEFDHDYFMLCIERRCKKARVKPFLRWLHLFKDIPFVVAAAVTFAPRNLQYHYEERYVKAFLDRDFNLPSEWIFFFYFLFFFHGNKSIYHAEFSKYAKILKNMGCRTHFFKEMQARGQRLSPGIHYSVKVCKVGILMKLYIFTKFGMIIRSMEVFYQFI